MAERNRERHEAGELSDRQKLILREIVDFHIKNGEPVGSRALTNIGGKSYSSATIRNEMAALEDGGYLESLHTSSGRVPTEMGYRFYVDWLRERYQVTKRELDAINSVAATRRAELDKILESATKLVSAMTNYTALSITPRRTSVMAEHYETVYLGEKSLLIVVMLGEDTMRTVRVYSQIPLTREAVTRLSEVLNKYAAGVVAEDINLPTIMRMEAEMEEYGTLIAPIIKKIYEAMTEDVGGEVKIEGVNNLLQYPEYSDVDSVKDLLSIFERRDDIVKLAAGASSDDVNVYIGKENAVDSHGSSSIVMRTVKRDGEVVGAIAIIGPRRMDYSRVMELLDLLAGNVSSAVSKNPRLLPRADEDGGELEEKNDTEA
ncbi:MAG: heat-inducible transcriptional repressor HrcA [Firmicutes bacterium]|nr:heat-inducible transcriptional repressor HrcA [Bacillota bacterium]